MEILKKGGSFLPENYQVPDKTKQFMKLEVGDNPIRFISAPLLGWILFTEDNQPIRRPFDEGEFGIEELEALKAKRNDKGDFEGSRHFWISLIWSYNHRAPKIFDITQISILKPFVLLINNPKWGDLRNYDVNINKTGSTKNDTEYSVFPEPPSDLDKEIVASINELQEKKLIDLNAIWKGEYPFQIYNW